MSVRLIPGSAAFVVLAVLSVALLVALLAGIGVTLAMRVAIIGLLTLIVATGWDYAASRRAWRFASPTMTRALPPALAIAVQRPINVSIEIPETARPAKAWHFEVHDHADPSRMTDGLPVRPPAAEGGG